MFLGVVRLVAFKQSEISQSSMIAQDVFVNHSADMASIITILFSSWSSTHKLRFVPASTGKSHWLICVLLTRYLQPPHSLRYFCMSKHSFQVCWGYIGKEQVFHFAGAVISITKTSWIEWAIDSEKAVGQSLRGGLTETESSHCPFLH